MIEEPEANTGVSTINTNIQKLIVERDDPSKYPPSRIARIINRSIEDKRYKSYPEVWGFSKGRLVENTEKFHVFKHAYITINRRGKTVVYPSITLPTSRGSIVINHLDKLVKREDIENYTEDQLYNFLALMTVVVGTAHVFPDGTGRTSVGLVDVFLRKYLNKKLNLSKLEKLDDKLRESMAAGTAFLFPEKYNPNTIFSEIGKGEKKEVLIPNSSNSQQHEVASFTEEFAKSIVRSLKKFNIQEPELNEEPELSFYRSSIYPIATLFKKVSIPVKKVGFIAKIKSTPSMKT